MDFALPAPAPDLPKGAPGPEKMEYTDLALEPVTDDEIETRELFQSEAALEFLEKLNRNEKARHGKTV